MDDKLVIDDIASRVARGRPSRSGSARLSLSLSSSRALWLSLSWALWLSLSWALVATPLGLVGSVWAQPEQMDDLGDSGGDRPWAEGVPQDKQEAALELFREGNSSLRDSLFVKAADQYREALKHWDHPAIHYNLALALLNLDQPLEVYEALESAMRYGPAPLDVDKYDRARNYKTLVEKQLARVAITCSVTGAKVSMDGKALFTAPGEYKSLVRVGEHSIIASKTGFITTNETRTLEAGELLELDLKLYTPDDLTRYRRKWSAWKPWAVVGAGAVVAALGGGLTLLSQSDFDEFDKAILDCGGCQPDDETAALRDRAELEQTVSFVAYAAGGAALLTGFVLVYINRAKPYRVDVEDAKPGRVTFAPLLAPDAAGVTAAIRF